MVGVAVLATAGVGAVQTASDPVGEVFAAEPATLSTPLAAPQPSLNRANSPDVSRSISRATLERQAETQARQRKAALKQLASKSEDQADKLLKEQKRKERLAEQREEAAEEDSDGLALSGEAPAEGQWVLPVAGYTLTATFGETSSYWSTVHTGLDFAAASGTPLVAVSSGTITSTGYDGAYGNKTVLTLDDGTEIWYCHQTSISVSSGQTVSPGDQIGTVGATGNVTGPHLHLEVRPGGGEPVDPDAALQEHGVDP